MEKLDFNRGWLCFEKNGETEYEVTLPHDAMLLDEKSETSAGGVNTGWYEAKDYIYEKTFMAPEEYRGQTVLLEFEGVYRKATVTLNGEKIGFQDYGYIGFFVDLTEKLKYGEKNVLQVEAVNSDQPNSRWYSGTGIYRPVYLYVLPKEHIVPEGIRVTTLDWQQARIRVDVKTTAPGKLKVEILDGEKEAAAAKGQTRGDFCAELSVPEAKLWSPETPSLYTCRVTYQGEEESAKPDVQEVRFGIRVVTCNPEQGFCINGKRVILRGACIHHDNGILGACAYDFAERRKVRILRENGYNALRSAHNPCSRAILDACDELGMLMMDEYVDMWYIHKTKYDYATEVEKNYEKDLAAIVAKDYNHPSVVLYSTGNEVSETAQTKGIALCKSLTDCLHALDPTRPVTCGVNIFFNFLSSMGLGVYSDEKAEQAAGDNRKKKAVGSEFFNDIAGIFGANFMKFGATLYPCDVKTRESYGNMDVAGYNYGIYRYDHDLKKYPNRIILGSETFCSDAYSFWEKARENKRLIGDFVWSGMDYLGETGIGAWEYEEYAPRFDKGLGWVAAGAGRIDLTGKPLSEMIYTQVAFEQKKIGIGVVPLGHKSPKHSASSWKMSNAMESWSWTGYEDEETDVEVYARAAYVALFLNGERLGVKRVKNNCMVTFQKVKYANGELRAVAYDENKKKIASKSLRTAGCETILTVEPEDARVKADTDLCYVRLKLTDGKGLVKPLERDDIQVKVEGGRLLGLGSACPYYTKSYLGDVTDTYYGEALAVIRPEKPGKVTVKAFSEKYGEGTAQILAL
ncbi:MAG: DUF4982 domain-containing protein [Clostridiales bacterium]|nr:DUF4982 domain-containing protein [Clostridiales bacterium]